ncbi:MAG: hypothetical protein RR565_10790 [Erysipelothrix sp.]
MKKLFAVLLVGMLVLTGCGKKEDTKKPEENAGGALKIGTGIVVAAQENKAGEFESNVTYATVVLDGDKVKQVQIDTNQNSQAKDFTATIKESKKILGEAYGMKKAGSKLEWNEQIAELEKWMVGKDLAEIKKAGDNADVKASVSVNIDGYIASVEKAIANAKEVKGLAKVGSVSSASVAKDKVEIDTTVTAVGFDKDGKVVYTFIDQAQISSTDELRTKLEKGADYGMKKAGSKLEWNEQIAKFNEWTIGKDLKAIQGANDDKDVKATVSINKDGFVKGIEAAQKAAVEVK